MRLTDEQRALAAEHYRFARYFANRLPRWLAKDVGGWEEVASECLVGLCVAVHAFDARSADVDLLGFAKLCMANRVKALARKERNRRRYTPKAEVTKEVERRLAAPPQRDAMEDADTAGWLWAAVAKLKPRHADILRRHYLDGVPYAKMGKADEECARRAVSKLRQTLRGGLEV